MTDPSAEGRFRRLFPAGCYALVQTFFLFALLQALLERGVESWLYIVPDVVMFLYIFVPASLPALAVGIVDGFARTPRRTAWGVLLKVVAWSMNLRSRLTGIATGDQAIFVRRSAFRGFPEIPLMEDIAFSRAMKRHGWPACLRERVRTSGRRWESRGVLRTIVLMWRLRLAYFFGARPEDLARVYYR